uniref:Uncharacterized protein LOC105033043 isoform X1 n=2 Tax=Elaeis guineensis var. tenera TaxID=51953 RepID=A0A6I9QAD6_ELAGV|nr:uncharacterized protein LOC105033043 isoform X1 [Elaeis guineensis]
MAESFSRWESDPLFSAAEVVQDSADRMESVFRMLLHENKLLQGDPSDTKLLSSVRYQRRDLVTALETTRWQLEDFERAVNLAALSDQSNSRENAIFKFRQLTRAIREQIVQVERSLDDSSAEDINRNFESMNLNEQDTDGLALFLSGGDSRDHHLHYDSGSSIMRRFLDSTTDGDAIVELKTEEVELFPMNGQKYSNHGYDSSKDNMLRKVGSSYSQREIETPAAVQGSFIVNCREVNAGTGAYDMEVGDPGGKCYPQKNRLRGSFWRFLRNFWLANNTKGSFTKRRKDGEAVEAEVRMTPSIISISPAEQGRNLAAGWIPSFRICEGSKVKDLTCTLQLYSWLEAIRKRYQRSQFVILNSRFRVRIAIAILVTLAVLGFFAFRAA